MTQDEAARMAISEVVTFVVNILFSSFNVPRRAGVGDYLENNPVSPSKSKIVRVLF
jgi:hypothetical protein